MNITYNIQNLPNKIEIHDFFEHVFLHIGDTETSSSEQNQALDEWFSTDELIKYLPYGRLIEARTPEKILIGAVFIGKQHPLTWPDGYKMEMFILGVHNNYRHKGVSKELILHAETFAKEQQAKSIILNTHITMTYLHAVYQKLGYARIGTLKNYYDNGDAVFFKKDL